MLDESTLSRYISNKIYYAKPMKRGDYVEGRGWDLPPDENGDDDGYVILYPDGYVSWNLKSNFEGTSNRTDSMSFGMALAALKLGKKVAREGWNGKDMYLYYQAGSKMFFDNARNPILRAQAEKEPGKTIKILPHIDMWTTNRQGRKAALPGWLASQTDMLSDDWVIVD